MIDHPSRIPIDDCLERHIYLLLSRNLICGVFQRHDLARAAARERGVRVRIGPGFTGIRQKFGERFLFEEHHWDAERHPTANPLLDLGELPEHIDMAIKINHRHRPSGRAVEWDGSSSGRPMGSGGLMRPVGWRCVETGEVVDPEEVQADKNTALFDHLNAMHAEVLKMWERRFHLETGTERHLFV